MMNPSAAAKTSPAINSDRTSSGKEHFEVLDDLRGSAAFLIIIFHLFNYSFGWDTPLSLLRHAHLVPSKETIVVVAALRRHIRKLPLSLRRSLTWDRGHEMAQHKPSVWPQM